MKKFLFIFVSIVAIVISLNFISASGCPAGWTESCSSYTVLSAYCWTGTQQVPYCTNPSWPARSYDHYCSGGDVYLTKQCCVGAGYGCSGSKPARTCTKSGFLYDDCSADETCQATGGWPRSACVYTGGGGGGGGPACTPTTEVYNSLDDDCDGIVDNLPFLTNVSTPAMAYWNFDSANGSNSTFVRDLKNVYNGTASGVGRPSGVKAEAYNFSGSAGYLNFTTYSNKVLSNFTLNAFVYVKNYSNAGIVGQWGNQENSSWILRTNVSGFSFATSDGINVSEVSYATTEVNNWLCLTAIYDGTNCVLYINGDEMVNESCYTPQASNYTLTVGRYSEITDTSYFNGTVDELAMWNTTFNTSQIDQWCGFYTYALNSSLNSARWYDLSSISSNISSSNINDTVYLSIGGQNLFGKTINYSIQRSTGGAFSSIENGSFAWNSVDKIGGVYYLPVYLNYSGLSASDVLRVNTSVYGTSVSNLSGNLTLSSASNSAPVANIILPNSTYYIFSNGTPINFTQNSTDSDDLLDILWELGDNGSASYSGYSQLMDSDAGDATYNYSNPGIYNVTLTVTESSRNGSVSDRTRSSEDSVTVQIVRPGVNLVPVITSPQSGSSHLSGSVFFNGSQSYVLNCSSSVIPGYDFITDDNLLYCDYLHAPGSYRGQNLTGYRLVFNWTMGDGTYAVKNWSSNNYYSDGGVEFLHYYPVSGWFNIKLKLTYEDL